MLRSDDDSASEDDENFSFVEDWVMSLSSTPINTALHLYNRSELITTSRKRSATTVTALFVGADTRIRDCGLLANRRQMTFTKKVDLPVPGGLHLMMGGMGMDMCVYDG